MTDVLTDTQLRHSRALSSIYRECLAGRAQSGVLIENELRETALHEDH